MSLRAPRLDRASEVNGPAIEQQLLGKRRFARIRVTDDGKGTTWRDGLGDFFACDCGRAQLSDFLETVARSPECWRAVRVAAQS